MLVDLEYVNFMVGNEMFSKRANAIKRSKETGISVTIVSPFRMKADKLSDYKKER